MDTTIDYRKESDDVIYITATAINNTGVAKEIEYRQTRSDNILEKASDYYLSVIRFDIPHSTLAIFNFRDNPYYVTIEQAGVDKTVQLIYLDYGNLTPNLDSAFQGVYYINQFLEMINTAFTTAHNNPPASPGNPPRIVLNTDNTFSLIVDTLYIPGTTDIFFNEPLYSFFQGLDSVFIGYNTANFKDRRLIYQRYFDNVFTYPAPLVGTYYNMRQESASQYLWTNLRTLILTTNEIPITKEYVSIGPNSSSIKNQAITDYIGTQEQDDTYRRMPYEYRAGSGYRLVDLKYDGPLNKIDFKVYAVDQFGFQFPLALAPGEAARVKFMFLKKSLENNEYNGVNKLIEIEKNY